MVWTRTRARIAPVVVLALLGPIAAIVTLAAPAAAVLAPSAAGDQATYLVSRGDAASSAPSLSPDGQYLAFASLARLVPGDTNAVSDVYVGRAPAGSATPFGGAPVLASVAADGGPANGDSSEPSVSADGHYVAFTSSASNLVGGDTNGLPDVFVRDLFTGRTTRVQGSTQPAAPGCTPATSAPTSRPAISENGRFLAFTSLASNLVDSDGDCVADVFRADLQEGTITRLDTAGPAYDPAISGDGDYVSFTTGSGASTSAKRWSAGGVDALGDGSANAIGQTSLSADGVVAYVTSQARHRGVDLPAGPKVIVEWPGGHWEWVSDGLPAGTIVSRPAISADGSTVAFEADQVVRVAVTEGRYGDDTAPVGSDGTAAPVVGPSGSSDPALSATGRTLALTTTAPVSGDTDSGAPDVVVVGTSGGDQALHPALDTAAGFAKPAPLTYVDPKNIPAEAATSDGGGTGTAGRGTIGRGTIGRGTIGRGTIGRGTINLGVLGRGTIGRGTIGRGTIGRGTIGRGTIDYGWVGRGTIGSTPMSQMGLVLDGGWPALLAGTPFEGVPLDAITFKQVCDFVAATLADANADPALKARAQAIYDLHLSDFDPESALGELAIGSVLLLAAPLGSIALPGGGATNLDNWKLAVQKQGFDPAIVTTETVVSDLDAKGVDIGATDLGSVVASSVPPGRTGFNFFGVGDLDLDTPLGQVGLAELGTTVRDAVVDCSKVDCATATLEKAGTAGAIRQAATLADLTPGLPARITLDEVVRSLIPPEFFPWEDVAWEGVGPGRYAIPKDDPSEGPGYSEVLRYRAGFDTGPGGAAYVRDATLTVQLPPGTAYRDARFDATGPRDFLHAWTPQGTNIEDLGTTVRFHLGDVPSGTTVTVHVLATDSINYDQDGSLTAELRSATGADTASITLVNPSGYGQLVDPPAGDSPATAPRLSVPNRVYFGGITSADDVDYVRIARPPAGKRLVVALGSVGGDLDLGAFKATGVDGPAPTGQGPSRLREDVLGRGHAQPAPLPLLDDPGFTLLDASTHSGTQSEQVTVEGGSGDVTLAIASGNGRVSNLPYSLRYLVLDEVPPVHCPAYVPPQPGPFDRGVLPVSLPPGTNTVFLVDREQFGEQFGTLPDPDTVLHLPIDAGKYVVNAISQLDGQLGLHVAVIPITGYPDLFGQHNSDAVRAARAAYEADPCSVTAANDLANATRDLLDGYLDAQTRSTLKNVVIVGGDEQIPFHRVAGSAFDAREDQNAGNLRLAAPRTGSCADPCDRRGTPEWAAARGDQVMTDDPYASSAPSTELGHDLWLPEFALGRLVETPKDVRAAVRTYLDRGGILTGDSSVAAGYAAWNDLPPAIAGALADRVAPAANKQLTGTWSRADLEAAMGFTGTGATPRIASLNAHSSETGLLPGDKGSDGVWRQNDVYSTADLPSDVDTRLDGRVLFTVGCHAGGTLPDAFYGSTGKDWAQVLGNVGGYVANTGYGLADDAALALSERLMANYADWIGTSQGGKPVTSGQALMRAKQSYLSGLGLYLGYDEKVLMQATYYGLPMWSFASSTAPAPTGTSLSWSASTSAGLTTRSATVAPTFATVDAGDGSSYLTVTGQSPQVTDGFPILAKLTSSLPSVSGATPHGGLITSLTSERGAEQDVTVAAATSGGSLADDRYDDIGFPSTLVSVTDQALTLLADRVDAAVTGNHTRGVFERFTSVGLSAYYSGSSDRTAPLVRSDADASGGRLTFTVTAKDASATVRAIELYLPEGETVWRAVELTKVGDTWQGAVADPGRYRAFAQVVDAGGNVGIDLNRGHLSRGSLATPMFDAGPDATIAQDGRLTRQITIADTDSSRFTATQDLGFGPQAIDVTRGPDGTWRAQLDLVGTVPGTRLVSVQVCDDSGLCTTHTFQLTVRPLDTAPEASVTLDTLSPTTDQVLTATGAGTDADGDPVTLSYQWWVDGTQVAGATGPSFDLGLPGHGDEGQTVSVVVTPDDGQLAGGSSSASAVVRRNTAPSVDAGADATVAEGSTWSGAAAVSDDVGVSRVGIDYGDGSSTQTVTSPGASVPLSHVYADNGVRTVTVTAYDADGASGSDTVVVTVTNVAPTIDPATPSSPVAAGTSTTLTVAFHDPGSADTHTVTIDWGDGTTSTAVVDEAAGTATATHTYAASGTYVISLTVTDDDGGTATASPYDYGVVYDSSGGYVTANGYFTSPMGAWPAQPGASGKAEFGMNVKYAAGSTAATGKLRFTYDVQPDDHGCNPLTCLELDSTTFSSIVVVGSKATLKGAARLNGNAGYSFVVSVIDGSPDKVRVRILDRAGKVVYDSQPGATETADPTIALLGGSVLLKKA